MDALRDQPTIQRQVVLGGGVHERYRQSRFRVEIKKERLFCRSVWVGRVTSRRVREARGRVDEKSDVETNSRYFTLPNRVHRRREIEKRKAEEERKINRQYERFTNCFYTSRGERRDRCDRVRRRRIVFIHKKRVFE